MTAIPDFSAWLECSGQAALTMLLLPATASMFGNICSISEGINGVTPFLAAYAWRSVKRIMPLCSCGSPCRLAICVNNLECNVSLLRSWQIDTRQMCYLVQLVKHCYKNVFVICKHLLVTSLQVNKQLSTGLSFHCCQSQKSKSCLGCQTNSLLDVAAAAKDIDHPLHRHIGLVSCYILKHCTQQLVNLVGCLQQATSERIVGC